jgi:transcriptional regulator GlxA family with amidase domain
MDDDRSARTVDEIAERSPGGSVMLDVNALVFPGFEPLDLYGPLEMFGLMPDEFAISVVAKEIGQVPSGRGLSAWADRPMADVAVTGLLLVPGGPGVSEAILDQSLLDWVLRNSKSARLTMSVCTGSLLLAKAGLLSGRAATTNKESFQWVVDQAADVQWVRTARWVEDGTIFTSSGVSAGMDMTLAVISHLHSRADAEKVALRAEYTWHDKRDIDPFAFEHGLS